MAAGGISLAAEQPRHITTFRARQCIARAGLTVVAPFDVSTQGAVPPVVSALLAQLRAPRSAIMSDDIGEEGQHSRDGLSAPNSEPNSAVQSPHNEPDEDMNDVNGDGEGEEGEGEEGEDAGDDSDSEEENGEDEGQDAQGGVESGERPDAAAEPQQQASGVAADQQTSQTSKPAAPKEKRARVRKWERKLVRIGHLQLLKWVPLEPREASQVERSENRLKRQISDNAPVTRSTTAAYHQRVRLERRAASRTVSYRDEEESGDTRDDE